MLIDMSVVKKEFGNTKEGKAVTLYSIKNKNSLVAEVTDFGAILVNLFVPDKAGNIDDVVLGYDKIEKYFENGSMFGATVGPSANRVANASFCIDGVNYNIADNNNGNNLHSDFENGYHKRLWNTQINENSVVFSLTDEDGSMGFPGNKKVQVTYTLTDENELKIEYYATSDKNTLINMTNHTYFNLAGHASGSIEKHKVQIKAFYYTPVNENLIPTGDLRPVIGTAFDFNDFKFVGEEIDTDDIQLKYAKGYDHNWVIDGFDGSVQKAAIVKEETTGRMMEVYTDQQGIQFYTANGMTADEGKADAKYDFRGGLCLETQAFPDSINQSHFPDVICGPQRHYKTTTIYKFI